MGESPWRTPSSIRPESFFDGMHDSPVETAFVPRAHEIVSPLEAGAMPVEADTAGDPGLCLVGPLLEAVELVEGRFAR